MTETETDTTPSAGTIVHLQPRGYGFIRPANGRGTIFFHASAIVGEDFAALRPGDRVRYIEDAPRNGAGYAVEVRRADTW